MKKQSIGKATLSAVTAGLLVVSLAPVPALAETSDGSSDVVEAVEQPADEGGTPTLKPTRPS